MNLALLLTALAVVPPDGLDTLAHDPTTDEAWAQAALSCLSTSETAAMSRGMRQYAPPRR